MAQTRLPIGIELARRDGWVIVSVAIPPRVCGLPNEACAARVQHVIRQVNPAAFDPVTPLVAEAAERDGLALDRNTDAPYDIRKMPPNCDGMALDDQEDDEGERIPGYPPGTSCAITGECE